MADCILIKDGLLVDTEWVRHEDILIEGSKIKRIAPSIDPESVPYDTTIISAEGKTYHRNHVCYVVDVLVDMHHVGRKLRQASVADNRHYEECRTALSLRT